MYLRAAIASVALLMLSGCGGGTAALPIGAAESLIRSGMQLHVWDESLVGASADSFSFWTDTSDPKWVTVDINVSNARNLKALYFDLQYDSDLLTPDGVDFTDKLAPSDQRLEQVTLETPGVVTASAVASGIAPAGFTGSGHLARVLFRRK